MRLLRLLALPLAALFCVFASPASAVSLNEVVVNDGGTDNREFVEICGNPGESLVGYTVVVIEGEIPQSGVIDVAIALTGVVPASGYYVLGHAAVTPDQVTATTMENGGETILLVQGFSSAVGTDIDVANDCVEDVAIGTIVDAVGLGLAGDCNTYYGAPFIGPDGTFDAAGLARCVDCDGGWGMICLSSTDPNEASYATCSFDNYIVLEPSPGELNLCEAVPVKESTWGLMKARF
jgi:hypothetical protein